MLGSFFGSERRGTDRKTQIPLTLRLYQFGFDIRFLWLRSAFVGITDRVAVELFFRRRGLCPPIVWQRSRETELPPT
jgi:hypothetical protein